MADWLPHQLLKQKAGVWSIGVETLDSVFVNNSITRSSAMEQINAGKTLVFQCKGFPCPQSLQSDGSHQGWVSLLLGIKL